MLTYSVRSDVVITNFTFKLFRVGLNFHSDCYIIIFLQNIWCIDRNYFLALRCRSVNFNERKRQMVVEEKAVSISACFNDNSVLGEISKPVVHLYQISHEV